MIGLMVVLWILLGLAVLIAALLFVPTDLGLEYWINDNKQRLVLHLRVLFIPIRIPLRMGEGETQQKQRDKEVDAEEEDGLFSGMTWRKFWRTAHGIQDAYRKTRGQIGEVYAYLRRKITVKEIALEVNFGLSDAAKTGIATGAVWTGGCCILSVIDRIFGIKKLDMHVTPDFLQECCNIRFKSIFTTQLVYIINIVLKALTIVNTFVDAIEQASAQDTNNNTEKGGV